MREPQESRFRPLMVTADSFSFISPKWETNDSSKEFTHYKLPPRGHFFQTSASDRSLSANDERDGAQEISRQKEAQQRTALQQWDGQNRTRKTVARKAAKGEGGRQVGKENDPRQAGKPRKCHPNRN